MAIAIVHGQFLAWPDAPQCVELSMLAEDTDVGIRLTGMVDVAEASRGASRIDSEPAEFYDGDDGFSSRPLPSFGNGDEFPFEFTDL